MKRLTNYLMAMAAMVFTFTSCEDVPSPFSEPYMEKELVSYAQAGSGTTDDPYNVSKAMALIDAMGNGEVGAEVYIKGIITDISELSAQYGNATYVIADALDGKERITVYRGYLLGGEKVTVGNELSEGDQVIVKGKLQHYVSSAGAYTPEIAQGNQLYSLNGQVADEQPSTGDDDAKAVTIAEFNAAAESTSVWYKLTGTVKGFKDSDIYGNFDLVDATGSVYVYGLLSEKGGEKKKFQELAAEKGIKEGTKITIIGNRGSYGDKIEVLNAYFVSVDGEGGETPSGDGKGTAEAPYDVTSAIAAGSGTGVYVKGYIVGNVEGQVLADGAKFSATGDSQTNILIAASANETDVTKCMPVQLPSGAIRTALNLKDNPGNYKKEVTLYGNIDKYFGATGIKSVTFAILDGKEIGTNPGGGSTPTPGTGTGTAASPLTVAQIYDAVAAMDAGVVSTADYYVKGKVCSVKYTFSAQYGTATFNISDDGATGGKEFIAYSCYYLGNEAWKDGDTQIQVGDEVIVCGKVVNYQGNTPEFSSKNNYIYSLNGKTAGGSTSGSSTGTAASPLTVTQVYDAVSAMDAGVVSTADYYVKGKVCSVKYTFSAQYGTATFNISDDGATGGKEFIAYSCYYLGNEAWKDGDTQIQVGDEVIVCGKVVNYQGNTPEFSSKNNYIYSLNGKTE